MSGKAVQTIQDVAAWTFVVETTAGPAAEPPFRSFARRFSNQQTNDYVDWNQASATIRAYLLSDAIIDGGMNGLWNSDGFIRGTNYLTPEDELSQRVINDEHLIRFAEDRPVIVGCNHIHRNYFHWLSQALPAIDYSLSRVDQVRDAALALPVLNAWQEESLRLLGYSHVRRITLDSFDQFYRFRNVEFTELVKGGASFRQSAATHRTYTRLSQAVPKTALAGRRIYVSRTDSTRRVLLNEGAVIEEMHNRGFEIVEAGSLTMAEQIRTFREASLVVGPHGAGLTNVVFCEPGTIVYEFLPTHYKNACFLNLGSICGLRYWTDAFESKHPDDGHPSARAWDLDLDFVRRRLDEIDRIQAELRHEASQQTIGAMAFLRGEQGQFGGRANVAAPVVPPRDGLMHRLLGRLLPGRRNPKL